MVKSFLTHELVVKGEPSLQNYVGDERYDYNELIEDSFREMLLDLKNQNLRLRQLCKPYSLQSSVTKTDAFDSAWITDKDEVERLRLVIDVTALTGEAVFKLEGRNSSSDTETEVLIKAIVEKGEHSFLISDVFKYYRIRLLSVGTTITYSSYLIEDTYTELHKLKARANIYHSLMATEGGEYQGKFEQYLNMYHAYLSNTKFPYDWDDDSEISEDESTDNINQNITFGTK